MEGIHQGKTARRRCRAKVSACVVPRSSCPLDAPRSSCCPTALSASPMSPAPPPLCMAHIFRHGTLRPRHPRPHRVHAHHRFSLQPSGQSEAAQGKVPRRQCPCREARALGVRVHGSIHQTFKPVTASVACAGPARRPALLHVTPFRSENPGPCASGTCAFPALARQIANGLGGALVFACALAWPMQPEHPAMNTQSLPSQSQSDCCFLQREALLRSLGAVSIDTPPCCIMASTCSQWRCMHHIASWR